MRGVTWILAGGWCDKESRQKTKGDGMETWQITAVDTLIGLIGAGAGGLVTHFWQQRRASDKALF